jgi:hypothetical protein
MGTKAVSATLAVAVAPEAQGEVLYNGIALPPLWPPRRADIDRQPLPPPYLLAPPRRIPIDVGRQLFVDDFLIESATLQRVYHQASYHPATPILRPDQPWECTGKGPMAMVFSDGVWFDPADRLFKMWYYAGHGGGATAYALSHDGICWEKPHLDVVPGTNIVHLGQRDSGTVWLDHAPRDAGERFKMTLYDAGRLLLFRSPDGIHWTQVARGGQTGDRNTFFYNPFRQRWVYSLRGESPWAGRMRHYWETGDFFSFSDATADGGDVVPWTGADSADPWRDDLRSAPQLYNLDCVAYESLLIGLFSIWRGDYRWPGEATASALELQRLGRPKQNSVCIGFSRDGFHWDRPDRRPFCPTSETPGDWNWGNMQSAANVCLVVGDQVYVYVSGRAGRSLPGCEFADAGGSTGLAILRRDGFASMNAGPAEGVLTTRPLCFQGRYLFVNAATAQGALRVEVLDECGTVIEPFTRAACLPVSADQTRIPLRWAAGADLGALAGKTVRFRFHLRQGALYAFWVSPEASGASHGYVAGGGPGFDGPLDTVGGGAAMKAPPASAVPVLDFKVALEVPLQELRTDYCWFHPRCAALQGADPTRPPVVVMTLQKHLMVSDFYSGLYSMRTDDLGRTWRGPLEVPELAWRREPDGTIVAVADVTPGAHAATGKVLAIGAQVRYSPAGAQLEDVPRAHSTAYAVYDPQADRWSPWRPVEMPAGAVFDYARSACAQFLTEDDGTLLVPFYHGRAATVPARVTVFRCTFDGTELKLAAAGNTLDLEVVRGLCEPSLARFGGRTYLTLRNDLRGYVTVSDDGLHYGPIRPWTFDDGGELGSYNTQQHWLAHSDGLFLCYTRRGANNDHIMRHRAPLFMAQVDPERLCVLRQTEQVLLPERGLMLGNFGAAAITAGESWVTDSEYVPSSAAGKPTAAGGNGSTFVARVLWSTANRLVPGR